jgi:selT/selW/selH-like putative selenoprotein
MQKYFQDVRRYIESNYPALSGNIVGDVYPPPRHAVLFASLASYLWFAGILLIFGGSYIFQSINVREPRFVVWINENKIQTFMMLFLLNNVANSMLSTGAFEIYVDGNLIFSKLVHKRFPSPQDIMEGMSAIGIKK